MNGILKDLSKRGAINIAKQGVGIANASIYGHTEQLLKNVKDLEFRVWAGKGNT